MSKRVSRPGRPSAFGSFVVSESFMENLEARRLMAASMSRIGDVLGYLATDFATRPQASQSRTIYKTKQYTLAAAQPNGGIVRTVGDAVLVKVVPNAKGANKLVTQLQNIGATLMGGTGMIMTAAVPLKALASVDGLSALQYADASYGPVTRAGKTDDYGVPAMNADKAARQYAVDGTGVRVGIISDSYNALGGAAAGVNSGDLPANGVTVVSDYTTAVNSNYTGGTDEGRGMAEIVHDVAPGAAISFYTANVSESDFANGITTLAKPVSAGGQGAKVVVDDVAYYDEPFFQDGIVAQAVNNAYANYGTNYFSAAGNEASQSFEQSFNGFSTTVTPAGSTAAVYQDWDPSAATNAYQAITIPAGGEFFISYQWDSPYYSASVNAGAPATAATGTQNSVSLYLLNAAKTGVVSAATTNRVSVGASNSSTQGDAYQILDYSNPSTTSAVTVYLVAKVRAGATPGYMKYIDEVGGNTIQYATNSGTNIGHAAASGGLGVGAAFYGDTPAFNTTPPLLEDFSSVGGTAIRFNANGSRKTTVEYREQPSIVAPDGAATTFFGGQETTFDGQYHFFGTSAAAPHAAGVAALMLQANPSLSNAQVYSTLKSTALDMGTAGFDYATGYGLVQADKALAAVAASSISGVSFTDANANGVKDAGETGVSGQTIFLDSNNNGTADSGTTTLTNGTSTAIADATATYNGLSRTTSSITSSLTGRVTNLTVSINATHARTSDLGFTLVTPSGVRIPLLTNLGYLSANAGTGLNITLSDAASTYISSTYSTGVLSGPFKPQTPLAAAINESAAGTWQLEARDYKSGTSGTLNSWSLAISYADPTATTDANGNYAFNALSPSAFYGTYRVRAAGTPSGYALTTPASPYDLTLGRGNTVTGDNFAYTAVAPIATVASTVIDDGTAQRSRVRGVTVTFNGTIPAANIQNGAFTLTQNTAGSGASVSSWTVSVTGVSASAEQTTVTLAFGGATQFGSIADGRYTLAINGSLITDNYGRQVDANGTGAGSTRTVAFHRLMADINGDASVNFSDFLQLQGAFLTSSGDSRFVSGADINGDNTVNFSDFLQLQGQFLRTI